MNLASASLLGFAVLLLSSCGNAQTREAPSRAQETPEPKGEANDEDHDALIPNLAEDGREMDPLMLEWKFRKGDVLRYKLTQSNYISGDTGAHWSDWDQNEVTLVLRMEIREVDSRGVGTVRITFDRVAYKTFEGHGYRSRGPMETRYDSETYGGAPPSDTIAALKGRSIAVKVSPRGEVLSLQVDDEAVRKCLSDEQLQAVMENHFGLLSPKPVGDSDKWQGLSEYRDTLIGDTTSKMRLDRFQLAMKRTCQIWERGRDRRTAFISVEGNFEVTERVYDTGGMEVPSAKSNALVTWLVDRGIMASTASTTKICVSWLLIHASELKTVMTIDLMTDE